MGDHQRLRQNDEFSLSELCWTFKARIPRSWIVILSDPGEKRFSLIRDGIVVTAGGPIARCSLSDRGLHKRTLEPCCQGDLSFVFNRLQCNIWASEMRFTTIKAFGPGAGKRL